jgi:hypothetical protein
MATYERGVAAYCMRPQKFGRMQCVSKNGAHAMRPYIYIGNQTQSLDGGSDET